VMAIRCSDTLTMPAGERRADALIGPIPDQGLAGDLCRGGVHGPREFDWARVPVRPGWKRGREYWLLARRSISDPDEIAYYACYGPRRSSTADLAWIAGSRWHIEPWPGPLAPASPAPCQNQPLPAKTGPSITKCCWSIKRQWHNRAGYVRYRSVPCVTELPDRCSSGSRARLGHADLDPHIEPTRVTELYPYR